MALRTETDRGGNDPIRVVIEQVRDAGGAGDPNWTAESDRLHAEFTKELAILHAKYRDSLHDLTRTALPAIYQALFAPEPNEPAAIAMPQPDAPELEIVELIDENMVFKNLGYDFASIIDEYIRSSNVSSDFFDMIINKIKAHHDDVNQ
jgi:hypothetical protein